MSTYIPSGRREASTEALMRRSGDYQLIAAIFVIALITANVGAVKPLLLFGSIPSDGGAVVFAVTYVCGDLLAEVYGRRYLLRAMWIAFGGMLLFTAANAIVIGLPSTPDWTGQAAYVSTLGFVLPISIASLCGFLAGTYVNAAVLWWMKRRDVASTTAFDRSGKVWRRLMGSTLAGETVDTTVFWFVAFSGVFFADYAYFTGWAAVAYILVGIAFKCAYEALVSPLTVKVAAWLKRRGEIDEVPAEALTSPFVFRLRPDRTAPVDPASRSRSEPRPR